MRDWRSQLDEELRFHFEESVAELVRAGWGADAAVREVRRRFGDEARYRHELSRIDRGAERRRRWSGRRDALGETMRQVLRGVVRSPGLSAGVVLAFALGIGVNATMFGILDRLLFSPPGHVVEPDGVRRLVVDREVSFLGRRVQSVSLAYPDYTDLLAVSRFSAVAAYQPTRVTIGRGETAERANAVMVTASWWPLLGVKPALGRFFTEPEDRIGGESVVVIGHGLWQRRFGGDASVLGRTVDFGHGPFTVIGVTPGGFTGVDLAPVDLWLPLSRAGALLLGERWLGDSRGSYWLRAVGRLAPGVSAEAAADAATAAHRAGRAAAGNGGGYDPEARIVAAPLIVARAALRADREPGAAGSFAGRAAAQEAKVALWLAGVSLAVLLIACVNVTNLLLARALQRRRETAIHVALGASRGRLLARSAAEAMVLAGLGGLVSILLTRWGGGLVRGVLLPGVEFADSGIGLRVLPFVFGLSVLAGLVSAVVPAAESLRRDPGGTIRVSSGGITRSTRRLRGALSMAQAALSVLLLVGAGLFLRSVRNLSELDLGFDPDGLWIATPDVEGGALDDGEKRVFFTAAAERIAGQPGVRGVAWSAAVPYVWSWSTEVRLPGRDSLPVAESGGPYVNGVNLDYFRTLDLRVVRGRAFEPADFATGLSVIVNEALAKLYWPGADPLGECMRIGERATDPPCSTVVGVTEDARRGSLLEEPNPQYYLPNTHPAIENFGEALFIRVAGEEARTLAAVRRTLLGVSPRVRHVNLQPMRDLSAPETRAWRLGATLFSLFGLLALLVAGLGLHSVLSFDVAQRRREIGLRTALGAGPGRIVSMVVGRAVRITLAGVAGGLVIALAAGPQIERLLYRTPARDPLTFLAVALVLLLTAALAALIPAQRAARVDPNVALRTD